MVGRILLGLIVAGVGFLMVWKTEPIYNFTGEMQWAQEKLGSTRFFIKLLGVGVSIVGFMIVTGLSNDVLTGVANLFVRNRAQ